MLIDDVSRIFQGSGAKHYFVRRLDIKWAEPEEQLLFSKHCFRGLYRESKRLRIRRGWEKNMGGDSTDEWMGEWQEVRAAENAA